MTWFKVDDTLAFHSRVVAAGNAAMGLWVRAGAWSSQQLTDGLVPTHIVNALGTPAQAERLVRNGLWERCPAGFIFHDWDDYNPDSASKRAKREAESSGGRRGNHARWHARQGVSVPGCEFCETDAARVGGESGTRARPDRVPEGGPESGASPPDPSRPVYTPELLSSSSSRPVTREDPWTWDQPRRATTGGGR